jgi:hypothetical protein
MPAEMFEKLYLEAMLKVILPINLKNFIKDNARHPVRLLKVGFTQFGGVLVKAMRTAKKLTSLNKKMKRAA